MSISRRTFIRNSGIFIPAIVGLSKAASVVPHNPHMRTVVSGGGSPSYLINQNFENGGATGYDNSESWTEGGTWNSKYTATPLAGSQSLFQNGLAGGSNTSPDFAATADLWLYFQLRLNTAVNNTELLVLRSSGGVDLCSLVYRAGATLRTSNGSANAETVGTISTGTKYHIWIHYTKGTGADGFASVGFSTDGVKPTSGNNYAPTSSGTATADAVRLRLEANVGNEVIFDRILISASTIGDNP